MFHKKERDRESINGSFCREPIHDVNMHLGEENKFIDKINTHLIKKSSKIITLTNSLLRTKMSGAIVKVQQGLQVSQAFKTTNVVPKMLLFMISTGEQSGRLGDMLERGVNFLDKTLDGIIDTITKMIEPIMLLVIGSIVLVMALALYLPLFQSYMN